MNPAGSPDASTPPVPFPSPKDVAELVARNHQKKGAAKVAIHAGSVLCKGTLIEGKGSSPTSEELYVIITGRDEQVFFGDPTKADTPSVRFRVSKSRSRVSSDPERKCDETSLAVARSAIEQVRGIAREKYVDRITNVDSRKVAAARRILNPTQGISIWS